MANACYQKVTGPSALNLYFTDRQARLAKMDIRTGDERVIRRWYDVPLEDVLATVQNRYGSFSKIKTNESKRIASRSFRTARRKFSMEERIKLIDEDIDDDIDGLASWRR